MGSLGLALPAVHAAEAPWQQMPPGWLSAAAPVAQGPDSGGWLLRSSLSRHEAIDPVAVRAVQADWSAYAPRADRQRALLLQHAEIGAAGHGWDLSALWRVQADVVASRGATDALYLYRQRAQPAAGSQFDVEARESGVALAGLRVGRSWSLAAADSQAGRWQGSVGLFAGAGQRVRQSSVAGQVGIGPTGAYSLNLAGSRQDSARQFGGFGRPDAAGVALAVDVGLTWQSPQGAWARLSVADLWSRVRVKGVATETLVASSATSSVDSQGYIDYRPLLVGRYQSLSVDRSLGRKWTWSAGVPWRGAVAGVRWERIEDIDIPAAWASWPLGSQWTLQCEYETRWRTVGVGLKGARGAFMLRTSSASIGRSHSLGFNASLGWPF